MSLKGDPFERYLLYLVTALALVLLGLAFISFPVGAYTFYSSALNGTSASATFKELYVFVIGYPVYFGVPSGIFSLGYTFFFVWAVYLAMFVLLVKGPWYNLFKAVRNLASDGFLSVYSSGALTWAFVFPAILMLTVFVESLLTTVGLPVGSLPDSNSRLFLWDITYAPLVEEVGFRVTIVGVIAMLLARRAGGGWRSLRALWHPSRSLGSLKVESWKQWGIYWSIIVSAGVFGAQHVLLGGGWEWGKAVSSFLVGLAFGIVYFTHGFPAAVMLHWGFNFFEGSYLYFDTVRGLPALTNEFSSLNSLQYGQFWVDSTIILMSVTVFALIAYVVGKSVMSRKQASRPATEPLPPVAPPSQ
jgi:hypothetical protein